VPRPRLRIDWLPVGEDAAGLAAYVPERAIAPDVRLGILRVSLDRDRSEFVVANDGTRAATQRTVAARRLLRRAGKGEANCAAVTGALKRKRRWWLRHGVGGRWWLWAVSQPKRNNDGLKHAHGDQAGMLSNACHSCLSASVQHRTTEPRSSPAGGLNTAIARLAIM
jgi:hypothetical protein